jgi:predicted O-methyltransferase YrrM
MTDHDWSEVDRYLAETLLPPDPVLDAALAAADAAGLPAIDVSPLQGQFLQLLARLAGARRILELGTLAGYSAIWLARALPPGGRLISLELEARYAEVARANLARAGFADVAEVLVGPALETLPRLEGPFDLIFIDADKSGYPEYLEWALRLARPGTLIVGDNTVRGGRVADPASRDANVQGARRFHELIAADPRLTATALQTVGVKGHDGFTLALVDSGA